MTSPVDLISGPKMGSTFWNLLKGITASLTQKPFILGTPSKFNSSKLFPAITLAAILAKGIPNAFETKGIVLDALGFTSRRYTWSLT